MSDALILLDNLFCTGQESKLIQCLHNGWRQHNCHHTEDVAVVCKFDQDPTSDPGSSSGTCFALGVLFFTEVGKPMAWQATQGEGLEAIKEKN